MKKFTSYILSGLLISTLLLSGCNQVVKVDDTPAQGMNGYYSFNPNEGHVYQTRTTIEQANTDPEIKDYNILWVPKGLGEYVLVEQVMTNASKRLTQNQQQFHEKTDYDLCPELESKEKQKFIYVYKDGTIKDGNLILTELYLPQQLIDFNQSWKFAGLTYTITQETTYDINGISYPAIEITFNGNPQGKTITGTAVFDIENHRMASYTRTVQDGNSTTLTEKILTQLKTNMKVKDIDYNCLNMTLVT